MKGKGVKGIAQIPHVAVGLDGVETEGDKNRLPNSVGLLLLSMRSVGV